MKQIGFKNFRRFQNFPTIDLAPITIFVGENNAGKSTVVKAILALLDFLNSGIADNGLNDANTSILNQQFYFNKSYFTHIGTFQRALNNKAEEDKISFDITFERYRFVIEIMGDREDTEAISGRISRILITFLEYNIDYDFDFKADNVHITFRKDLSPLWKGQQRQTPNTLAEQDKKILNKYYKSFDSDIECDMPISGVGGTGMVNTISSLIYVTNARIRATVEAQKRNRAQIELPFEDQFIVEGLDGKILKFFSDNVQFFSRLATLRAFSPYRDFSDASVEYIYAHAVTQTVIYSAKDINDYFVKTIHEFANQRVLSGSEIHTFILKWMNEFKIGTDYEISSVGGEAHIVKIQNNDGTSVNLADKGMGSIQLMILLFRLATKMSQSSIGYGGRLKGATIIVEEPEQNLHPMLQSKLAELFYSLNQEYGFRFIIETHSEYLIRRTQALVGASYRENTKFDNPFKVYYFPADGTPYDMPYAKSGRFEEQFGTGFFDEATKWNREVLRNENSR